MTSHEIRQSFLDFFREKQHTIVPSSSLMPDSPNLLFTNAGMNQFVPIFLGERLCPYKPGRAADTQKCIRAGGKHNDLDDVGLDTYHHTFFEMLGNWSFGDYFKKEAIEWTWELVVDRWKFPAARLYATVYKPGPGDPSDFDQEAHDHWARLFKKAGLDPAVHIVNGNKKDNFWMMGDTGPCGPCSELHVDLTQNGDTRGALVNKGSSECIEIWNLVFIQFNANPDGTFSPLPAKHVDTGMGFERVTSIMQCTKNFTGFGTTISNYETDIFRPIFHEIEKLSGKTYASTLPGPGGTGGPPVVAGGPLARSTQPESSAAQIQIDIAFRVIADHIRTLSFAIADGIQPGNTDRNYVLRRILRRAVRYGRTLGFHEPFFYKLVDVLAKTMGDVFPEIRAKAKHVEEVLKREEEAFNKTLDRGIEQFYINLVETIGRHLSFHAVDLDLAYDVKYKEATFAGLEPIPHTGKAKHITIDVASDVVSPLKQLGLELPKFPGTFAFELYDTYGFPLDLTELMARERGLTVDVAGFEKLMDEQRARARAAQKKQIIALHDQSFPKTEFIGYENLTTEAKLTNIQDACAIVDQSPLYAAMGGQVGDTGLIEFLERPGVQYPVLDTIKNGETFFLRLPEDVEADGGFVNIGGERVRLTVDAARRAAIQRHHTVTHLLHWALHEVVSRDASQKGSFVGAEKLTFDFNSAALTPEQVADVEKLVNEKIVENAGVSWTEVPYAEVKKHPAIMQFFGDKYGDVVRVVQVGGHAGAFDGYSMELCGGTHTRATGEIGLFRIVAESAIAAGVRRIEAVAGLNAYEFVHTDSERLKSLATKLNAPLGEIEKKLDAMLVQQKELEKNFESMLKRQAHDFVRQGITTVDKSTAIPLWIAKLPLKEYGVILLPNVLDALRAIQFRGVAVLGGVDTTESVQLGAYVSPEFTAKVQAGKIIQTIAPIVGGKGGGKPDNARGGGKDASKLDEALAKARQLLG